MNLDDFNIFKEDDDTYHVAHPKGGTMIINKENMSPLLKSIMASRKAKQDADATEATKIKSKNYAKGGQVFKPKKYADGGQPQAADAYDPTSNVNSSSEMADNSDPLANATPNDANSSPQTVDAFEFRSKNPANGAAAIPPGSVGSSQAPNTGPGIEGGLREQQMAAKAYADAISGQGAAEVAAQKAGQDQIAQLPTIQSLVDKREAMDNQYKIDIANAKLDPNRVWNNKSVPAKIFAGLGMLLSGAGSGLTGQENLAAKSIQQEIERDIDAQKNDQSNIMNAWKMNREALGSDMAANLATRNQAYIGVSHQLDQAASQFKGPIAQAQYQKTKGMIDQELAVNRWKMSMLQGPTQETAGGAGAGTESAMQNHLNGLQLAFPEYYKDAQSKYVPSVGMASVPVTPDDKTELTNYDNLSRQLKGALDFQNQVGLTGAWTPQTKAQANTIKQNLVLSMNQLNNSKRPPSPEVMKLYNEAVGGIGNVNLGGTKQEIQDLQEQVQGRKENLMNHLGVKPFSDAGSSNIIRSQNGVKYEKVPGGWKKI